MVWLWHIRFGLWGAGFVSDDQPLGAVGDDSVSGLPGSRLPWAGLSGRSHLASFG